MTVDIATGAAPRLPVRPGGDAPSAPAAGVTAQAITASSWLAGSDGLRPLDAVLGRELRVTRRGATTVVPAQPADYPERR